MVSYTELITLDIEEVLDIYEITLCNIYNRSTILEEKTEKK